MRLKKSGKKVMASLGVAALGLTLVGCQSGGGDAATDAKEVEVNKTGFPVVDETITLKMMGPGTGMQDWADMPLFQEYAEKTNIEFDFITPPMNDFQTNLNLAFASGDLPDIIFGAGSNNLTRAMEIDLGSQGVLLPLEDLIEEYAPNLSKILEENPDIRKNITAPDGHIYSLPVISAGYTAIWPWGPLWYNGEWLDALGVEELPTTVDEFFDLMVRFRDEDPNGNGIQDEIPITDGNGLEYMRTWLLPAFGMTDRGIEEFDGVVKYTPMMENYRAYLEFMNKLWEEEILDHELYSQSDEQKKSKGQNNQVGLFQDWFSYFTTGQTEEGAINDPMFLPLTSEWSEERIAPGSSKMNTGAFAITSSNPNPEASIRWADYFYSEEGYIFANQGPEGALWEYDTNDEGEQVRVYTEDVDKSNLEDERGKVTPWYGIAAPGRDIPTPNILLDANNESDTRFGDFIISETEEKITPYAKVSFPPVYLTVEESNEISIIATDLETYVEQMEARFITGVEPLENWDTFVETMESMGVQTLVDVYQQAFDRWDSVE